MFASDVPISSASNDLLGRASFSKALATAMIRYQRAESIVIGLYGEWGSGKTSVINMAVEEVQANCAKIEGPPPIVVKFCPWNFSDQNQLITQFFNALSNNLKRVDEAGKLRKISEKLKTYASVFKPLKYVPTIGGAAGEVLDIIGTVSEEMEEIANARDQDLDQVREELNVLLKAEKRKLIVLIDDIDRLTSIEMRQIFQLVKSLGDFPYTTYLLAMDKNIVVNSLSGVQSGNGEKYLEKIVQIPFEIPQCARRDLDAYLYKSIDQIISSVSEKDWDRELWSHYVYYALTPMIRSLRDANRLINHLSFAFPLVQDEVFCPDFIAISAIQIFAPHVFQAIRDHRDEFAGIFLKHQTSKEEELEKIKGFYEECFKAESILTSERWGEFLVKMFPRLSSIFGYATFSSDFVSDWRKRKRVCSTECFDRYFRLSLASDEISSAEIIKIFEMRDADALARRFDFFAKTNKMGSFLTAIGDMEDGEFSFEFIEVLLLALGRTRDGMPDERGFLILSTRDRATRLISWLISTYPKKKRARLCKSLFSESSFSFNQVVHEIYLSGAEHGFWGDGTKVPQENRTFSAKEHKGLQKVAQARLKTYIATGALFSDPRPLNILYRWTEWTNEKEVNRQIAKWLKTKGNDFQILKSLMTEMHSMNGEQSFELQLSVLDKFVKDIRLLKSAIKRIEVRGAPEEAMILKAARLGLERFEQRSKQNALDSSKENT